MAKKHTVLQKVRFQPSPTLPKSINCDLVKDIKTYYKQYVLLWLAIGAKKFFEDGHMNIPDDKILQTENMSKNEAF